MVYEGRIRLTARTVGGCGWSDLDQVVWYSVDVADFSEIKAKVEELLGGAAKNWHDETGCECDGIVETVFRWDE